jgi:hypothetical protein
MIVPSVLADGKDYTISLQDTKMVKTESNERFSLVVEAVFRGKGEQLSLMVGEEMKTVEIETDNQMIEISDKDIEALKTSVAQKVKTKDLDLHRMNLLVFKETKDDKTGTYTRTPGALAFRSVLIENDNPSRYQVSLSTLDGGVSAQAHFTMQ